MKTNSIRELTNAALIEQEHKWKSRRLAGGESYEMGLTQNFFTQKPIYFYIVNIHEEPVSLEQFKSLDPDVRLTKGLYSIQYIPACDKSRNPKFPYLIGQDLVRLRITVSGPRHWDKVCERIPELGWIKRNSTMTNALFPIAKKHPGLVLKFGVDFVKYCEKIENRAIELGIDIDHKPLVTYQWSNAVKEKLKDKKFADIKTKDDYREVLDEVERSKTVQDEIGSIKKGE